MKEGTRGGGSCPASVNELSPDQELVNLSTFALRLTDEQYFSTKISQGKLALTCDPAKGNMFLL